MEIINYCNGTWPSTGGVARYDTQLSLIFPERKFFKGPKEKNKMLDFLKTCKKPIVITDNHLACHIPNDYPVLLIHQGCALTTAERNPDWDPYWRDLCCNGQKEMLTIRDPKKTWIISCSKSCIHDFRKFYPKLHPRFKLFNLVHPSELNENNFKSSFNKKPVILGNWSHVKKGKHLIPTLKKLMPEFELRQLSVIPEKNESLESFNLRKQNQYLESDIFLQVSNSEGSSYSTIDAMICGLVTISTNVGKYFADVPDDCFVKLNWEKCYGDNIDYEYISKGIRNAWTNKEELSKKGRDWYMNNCRFDDWEKKMKKIVSDFYEHNYNN